MSRRGRNTEKWTEQLSLLECQRRGWDGEIVGHWWYDGHVRRRRDLLGFVDLLACIPSADDLSRFAAIQFTSRSNVASRVKKIRASNNYLRVVDAWGWYVLVWGWSADGTLREVEVTLESHPPLQT